MLKKLFLTVIIFSAGVIFAQKGNIKGTVVDSDNNPLASVNVFVLKTNKGTTTNFDGEFFIKNLKAGTYKIKISSIGFATKTATATVIGNETTTISSISLQESDEQLSEVTIDGNKENKFYNRKSINVSKLPLADIENPQVYNSISSELLKEQVVTNFNDALKNATGISRLWESTGRGGDGAEFFSLRGFSVQPTMINGLPGLNNGGLDPANIESVEVIKGPSGTLYGSSLISYGGLINVVTKKPYESFGGEINYTTGSNGLSRITADVNTPLGESDSAFLRINTAYHTESSFQDAGESTSFYVAPSLKFIANERLTFLINTEFLNKESVNAPMLFLNRNAPLSYNNIDIFDQNYKNSFTSNNLSIKNPTYTLQAQALYKISDEWTSQTVLSKGTAKTDGYYSYLWDLSDGDTFAHYIAKIKGETRTTDIQQNFIGDFKLGNLRNRVVIGLDYLHTTQKDNSTGWLQIGEVSISQGTNSAVLSQASVDNILAETAVGNTEVEQEIYSAYISNVINFTPSLSAMASLRVDKFEGEKHNDDDDQTAFSPKFGLVYQPLKNKLSVFANYMNGFSNVSPTTVSDIDGSNPRIKTFEPEKANQWEVGFKTNLFNNKLAATVNYYDITVSNKLMTDPNNINNSIQGGEVESKGFEISFIANPLEGLNIIAGYSNNKSEVLKETEGAGYLGLRPEEAGPEELLNFWASYTFSEGSIKGFGLGFGGNHASEFNTLNRRTTGSFTLPSYTVFNSSLSYTADKYRIILKLDNITDEKYYTGWSTVSPQNLRSVSASFSYNF
ncbi:TonB-dependent receptor [Tenacibaculum sp. IB213877]|uniref:TonB-dependent receptor n=1 Tax=Tenacibaculum sp. IB213877 TaxID=3097351 RepID=UPI002A59ED7E|nr:TonB-dependent receptor [Tenacibaculum sp. IB213877]MDY0779979.1 TonB-dependent receptor [Tenacibaculum sp. IB213877]